MTSPSPSATKRWIFIANTQKAGTAWLGNVLASDRNVVYRHNRVPLTAPNSVFGRSFETVAVAPGLEGIEKLPGQFSLADGFRHLEHNADGRIFVQSDAGTLFYVTTNLSAIQSQCDFLRSRDFRLRNIVMDPVRAIEAVSRMLCGFAKKFGSYPIRPVYGFDDLFYKIMKPKNVEEFSEDDIFLRTVLHLSHILSRDMRLAILFSVPIIIFERLITDRNYLARTLADMSDGEIDIPVQTLTEIYSSQKQYSATSFQPARELNGLFPARNIWSEGKNYYKSLDLWKRRAIDFAYTAYGVFHCYEKFGYIFDYVGTSTELNPMRLASRLYRVPNAEFFRDVTVQDLLERCSPEYERMNKEQQMAQKT